VPGGVFQTADGWMSILAINDRDWKSLCAAMDMPALAVDPRFADPASRLANEAALYAIVRPAIAARPCADWARRLTDGRIMHERLNSYAEFLDQPHVRETGLIHWLEQAGMPQPVPVPALPGTPAPAADTPRAVAPVPGQHSQAILAEHGFAPHEIAALLAEGIVAGPAA
jgi:crotonobetainyl-CoA:carnitine CoA-transferase CaiB-like acyl-CoA transferase